MHAHNHQTYLQVHPNENSGNQDETFSPLSYSLMAKQIDDQESLSPPLMAAQEDSHASNKSKKQAIILAEKLSRFESKHGIKKSSLPQELEYSGNNLVSFGNPNPAQKSDPQHKQVSHFKVEIKRAEKIPIFQQQSSSKQCYLLPKSVQDNSCQKKSLGHKIIQSLIIKHANKNQEIQGPVDQQSLVLPKNAQEESVSHFQAASFDSSEKNLEKSAHLGNPNQDNFIILGSQAEVNIGMRMSSQKCLKNPDAQSAQLELSSQKAVWQSIRESQQKKGLLYRKLQNHLGPNSFRKPNLITNQPELKMEKTKTSQSPNIKKERVAETQKAQGSLNAAQIHRIRKDEFIDHSVHNNKASKPNIQAMKNSLPEQYLNGMSSFEGNQRQRRYETNRIRLSESSAFLIEQIQNLKKKIKELQKGTKREASREQSNIRRVNSDKNNFSIKHVSINYKDYNQTSQSKLINKKNLNLKKQISSEISFSEDQFLELEVLMSLFKKTPTKEDTPQQLTHLSLEVFQRFGIKAERMSIQRLRQGVLFEVNESINLIWLYDGQMYLGQAKSGRQGIVEADGEGVWVQPNIFCYKGMFSKNKKNGFGIYLNAKGDKYKGDWKNDYFHGKGKLFSQISEYEGHFQKGFKQGQGTQVFTNGDVYKGQYEDDKFHGRGKYCWKNKTVYVGDFKIGFMEGQGFWRSKKDSYEGQYYRNMKHGYGVYRWANGTVYQGKFENGVRVSKTNRSKPTIAVEKEITYDVDMSSSNQSEFYEVKLSQNDFKVGRRFTVQNLEEVPKQRKKGNRFNLVKQ